jgi:hypothetical protein
VHYWKDDRCLGAPIGSIQLKYVTDVVVGGDCKWDFDGVPDEATSNRRFELRTDSRDYHIYAEIPEDGPLWGDALTTAWKTCLAKSRSFAVGSLFDEIAESPEDLELLRAIASDPVRDDEMQV